MTAPRLRPRSRGRTAVQSPSMPPPPRSPLALPSAVTAALAAAVAFAAACATPGPSTAEQWRSTMQAVDGHWEVVDRELQRGASGDLQQVADAARAAAALVRRGYGPQELTRVPEFARMARDCESWLLAIALEADQGHGELARELVGKRERCAVCHDRAGKRPW